MRNCPGCGSRLTDRLVDAIENPLHSEECPKILEKKAQNKKKQKISEIFQEAVYSTFKNE